MAHESPYLNAKLQAASQGIKECRSVCGNGINAFMGVTRRHTITPICPTIHSQALFLGKIDGRRGWKVGERWQENAVMQDKVSITVSHERRMAF